MNPIRQISLCWLAALIGVAQISNSLPLDDSRFFAVPQQVGNALHQVKQQQDQSLFGIAEQRGNSAFSQNNSKPPAPVNPLHFSYHTFFSDAQYLAKFRQYDHFCRLPIGLEVSDIIFPFHSFW